MILSMQFQLRARDINIEIISGVGKFFHAMIKQTLYRRGSFKTSVVGLCNMNGCLNGTVRFITG